MDGGLGFGVLILCCVFMALLYISIVKSKRSRRTYR